MQIGRISRFGLLEMSRQRLKPSLGESTQIICPRCSGHGTIRTVESLALSLIRIMEEEALKENSARVDVHVPVDVATYMLNEKRKAINEIEQQTGIKMVIIANPSLETPQYRVERIRKSEIDEASSVASYKQIVEVGEQYSPSDFTEKVIQPEQPAVTAIAPSRPAPLPVPQPTGGFLTRIVSLFTGEESKAAKEKKEAETAKKPAARRSSSSRGGKPKSQAQTGQGRRRGGRKPGQTQKGGQRSEQQRKPKSAQQSDQQAAEAKSPAQDSKEQSGESKPRSRGRRGGRGRRSSGSRQRQADTQQTNESQKPSADKPAETPAKPVEAQAPKASSESSSKPQDKESTAVKTEARKHAPAAEAKPETVATGEEPVALQAVSTVNGRVQLAEYVTHVACFFGAPQGASNSRVLRNGFA